MEEGQEGNNQAQSSLAIPPSRSLPLPCTFFSLSLFFFFLSPFSLTLVSSRSVSSVSSLPGYTGPQGDLLLARVPQHRALSSPPLPTASPPNSSSSYSFCSCPPPLPLLSPPSFSSALPRGKTVRPSSPELSISEGVYLQRDRPTHLERIFTSVHTLSPSHSLLALHISQRCHQTHSSGSFQGPLSSLWRAHL